jgi:hypothetical protein
MPVIDVTLFTEYLALWMSNFIPIFITIHIGCRRSTQCLHCYQRLAYRSSTAGHFQQIRDQYKDYSTVSFQSLMKDSLKYWDPHDIRWIIIQNHLTLKRNSHDKLMLLV